MSDSLSYADSARKALSLKALKIVANHSPIDDWPPIPTPPRRYPQPKVVFGTIGLDSSTPLSSTPTDTTPPTKTPTFSVGLDGSTAARLRSRTRGSEDPESSTTNIVTPLSATTPNKWKFGTTSSTPIINGKKPLPEQGAGGEPSSSCHQKGAISFGNIDSPLPLDLNISNTKSKPKSKPKSKINSTKSSPNRGQLETSTPIDDYPITNPDKVKDLDSDADFKVKDFGYGFGSGGLAYTQVGLTITPREPTGDNETGDNQNLPVTTRGHHDQTIQSNPNTGLGLVNDIPQPPIPSPIHAPVPVQQPYGPPPYAQPHGHIPRSSRRGIGNVARGGGGYNERGGYGFHERGGYERGGRRGGRGGTSGYSRGYPSGRGYNRGGGPGSASSHSSPSSGGGGGPRGPFADNITSPVSPPLPLHFSQLPHPQQHGHGGIDPMYYQPPRQISGGGGPFDPYQPYPHLQHQQQHSHQPPYPHFQQPPPPPPPHLLPSKSISNTSASTNGGASPSVGDDVGPSTNISTSPPNPSESGSPKPNVSLSSSSSTPSLPGSSSPSSSHIPPPVPIPLTILPFPLDSTRYHLLGQLEYYMSPQNMAQDFFLRTQMDSKGYIPISLLASFNRIKQLTLDTRLVKEVLLLSAFVEVRGGMVRMGPVSTGGHPVDGSSGGGGGNEILTRQQGGWEAFVLPDAAESIVEDVENAENGGYSYHDGYGYGGSGYGYGYGYGSGSGGYGYGYGGYGYPPGGPGLGYYEDPQYQQPHHQQQQQQQSGGGYEPGVENEDEHGHTFPHDHGSSMINGHTAAAAAAGSEPTIHKLDDPSPLPKEDEDRKPNGILKHDRAEEEDGEDEEEEEEEEEVVFVMGTDVGPSWVPERERRV